MDLSFAQEDQAFRAEVREFLIPNPPEDLARREARGSHLERAKVTEWQPLIYDRGRVAPNWPKPLSGTGWTPIPK